MSLTLKKINFFAGSSGAGSDTEPDVLNVSKPEEEDEDSLLEDFQSLNVKNFVGFFAVFHQNATDFLND